MNLSGIWVVAGCVLVTVGCGGSSSSSGGASLVADATSNAVAQPGSQTLALPEARGAHTAVRLRSGEVLVVGGLVMRRGCIDHFVTDEITAKALLDGPG